MPPFTLLDFTVIVEQRGNNDVMSQATVKLRVGDEVMHTAAEGEGPVNALDQAIRKALLPHYPELADVHLVGYKVRIVNEHLGTAAKPRVLIESARGESAGARWAARRISSRPAGRRCGIAWSCRCYGIGRRPTTDDRRPRPQPCTAAPLSPPRWKTHERHSRHRAQSAHMPEGVSSFLNTRSLATAQRRLSELLRPGMAVLDVGCGSGAITRGIAEAVAPGGRVVGLDINPGLIAEARQPHADVPGLSFELADLDRYNQPASFDIVTAARVVQWLADPLGALRKMAALLKPGGRLLVLDYNHELIAWQPEPPASFMAFYAAFLRWRADAGMDNAIADHLADLFAQAGLTRDRGHAAARDSHARRAGLHHAHQACGPT